MEILPERSETESEEEPLQQGPWYSYPHVIKVEVEDQWAKQICCKLWDSFLVNHGC